ncbi:MAG: hypothetical protein VB031_06465 [Eubacteriaceae bacterium]|nr:hypothetical protein [Eubacteriaceae bacterium]
MEKYIKEIVMIAFVIVASIAAYLIISNCYVFSRSSGTYGIMAFVIKSCFVMTDIGCIVAIMINSNKRN